MLYKPEVWSTFLFKRSFYPIEGQIFITLQNKDVTIKMSGKGIIHYQSEDIKFLLDMNDCVIPRLNDISEYTVQFKFFPHNHEVIKIVSKVAKINADFELLFDCDGNKTKGSIVPLFNNGSYITACISEEVPGRTS